MGVNTSNSRSKKMARDFLVYSVGMIGSKLMTFMLLPLYTYFISDPSEYGYFDLCLTACFLLMPLVTLQMRDGAFRFLLETDNDDRRSHIVTYVNKTLFITTMLTVIVAVGIYFVKPFAYLGYTVAMLVVMSFYDVYAQTVRGLGDNRSFVAVSLVASLGIVVFSVVFLVVGMGIEGLFLANILARLLALVVIDLRLHALRRYFRPSLSDCREIGREILRFSLPMLPVGICWWFIGFSNRSFITHYLSLHDSGIYGMASRLATVVQAIATIFLQTWQENAIQQYHSADRNRFFSQVFNGYILSFAAVIIVYGIGAKLVFPLLFNVTYAESVTYLYPLCVATMLFALAGYFEIIYQCEKKTLRLVPPLIIAPFINVVLNCVLIKSLGINGAIISYAATYAFIIAYRWVDVRKWVQVKLFKSTLIPIGLMGVGALPFVLYTNAWIDVAIIVLCLVAIAATPQFRALISRR